MYIIPFLSISFASLCEAAFYLLFFVRLYVYKNIKHKHCQAETFITAKELYT